MDMEVRRSNPVAANGCTRNSEMYPVHETFKETIISEWYRVFAADQ